MSSCTLVDSPTLFDPAVGGETLDEVIVAAWEGLGEHRTVGCPVCGGEMRPEYGVHARPIGGACLGCGSRVQ